MPSDAIPDRKPISTCRRRLPVFHLVAVTAFLVWVAQFYDSRTGFTELIDFGEQFEPQRLPTVRSIPRVIVNGGGDDGQFYAQMAVDPMLRDPAIDRALDAPAYRARRILFSWTAYLLGLGRPGWILQAYALQNVAAWLLLAWILLRWFPPDSTRQTAQWIACLFNMGTLWSVRHAMLDGPSLLMIATGMMAVESDRRLLAACIFGVAGLGRETNLLAVAALLDPAERGRRNWIRQIGYACLVAAPSLAWLAYVRSIYRAQAFTAGGTIAPAFAGYLWIWRLTLKWVQRGWWLWILSLFGLVSITTQAVVLVWLRRWRCPWWRLGFVFVVLLATLGPVWGGIPGAYLRVLLPLTVAFNVVLPTDRRWFWPVFVLANLTLVHVLWMVIAPRIVSAVP